MNVSQPIADHRIDRVRQAVWAAAPSAGEPTIRLRRAALLDEMEQFGLNNPALAKRAGLALTSLARVLNGRSHPGERFIAGMLLTFPHLQFADLFDVIDAEAQAS